MLRLRPRPAAIIPSYAFYNVQQDRNTICKATYHVPLSMSAKTRNLSGHMKKRVAYA